MKPTAEQIAAVDAAWAAGYFEDCYTAAGPEDLFGTTVTAVNVALSTLLGQNTYCDHPGWPHITFLATPPVVRSTFPNTDGDV